MNSLTAAELKRRGMAAIEEGLRRGPVQLIKRNRVAAVVLSATDYARLQQPPAPAPAAGVTAIEWLLSRPAGRRARRDLDRALRRERTAWS